MQESTLKKKVLKIAAAGLRTAEAERVTHNYLLFILWIIYYLFVGVFPYFTWFGKESGKGTPRYTYIS